MVQANEPQYDMIEVKVQDLDPKKPDTFYDIEVDHDATVENLKCNISIVTGYEITQMELYFNRDMLRDDNAKINQIGIQCFDMIDLKITLLSTKDQDLMNMFFDSQKPVASNMKKGPYINMKQVRNQMVHNAQI